jgi:hypothetical protein
MSSSSLTAEDIEWIEAYAAEVAEAVGREFDAASDRFKEGNLLLARFKAAIESVLKNGAGHFLAVDEAHNELCVASALLANTKLKFIRLEYEPLLRGCTKTIDFRAMADSGQIAYVDVKTIRPKDTDRWDQFEKAKDGSRKTSLSASQNNGSAAKSGTLGLPRGPECWSIP